jgi:hypothetical protein
MQNKLQKEIAQKNQEFKQLQLTITDLRSKLENKNGRKKSK